MKQMKLQLIKQAPTNETKDGVPIECPECGTTGDIGIHEYNECPVCSGIGWLSLCDDYEERLAG